MVLGHCNDFPLKKYIYAFHMPLFFILSGFLFHQKRISVPYVRDLLRKYIMPYFVLCLINLVIKQVTQSFGDGLDMSISHSIIGIVYSSGTGGWMPTCTPLWFLTCLFLALVICSAIHTFFNRIFRWAVILVGVGLTVILDAIDFIKLPWNLDVALMAILFLHIEYEMKRLGSLKRLLEHKLFARAIITEFAFVVGTIATFYNPKSVDFCSNTYGNPVFMVIGAIGYSVVVIMVSTSIANHTILVKKALMYLSKHTILSWDLTFQRFLCKISAVAYWIIELDDDVCLEIPHSHRWFDDLAVFDQVNSQ